MASGYCAPSSHRGLLQQPTSEPLSGQGATASLASPPKQHSRRAALPSALEEMIFMFAISSYREMADCYLVNWEWRKHFGRIVEVSFVCTRFTPA